MTLRALIVDDEPPARAELRYQLERHPDVEVIGEAQNAREALALVEALGYDVIFLDIQMPSTTGLELVQRLHQGRLAAPYVVFVTAYDEHVLQAYGLSAIDYLLKPVSAERLAHTLDRLRVLRGMRPQADGAASAPASRPKAPRFLSGHVGDTAVPVPIEEISYLEAGDDLVHLRTARGVELAVRTSLQELQASLPDAEFFRCHRSYIVNLREVAEIVPFFNGTYVLRMKGSRAQVPVSRANVRRLRQLFGLA